MKCISLEKPYHINGTILDFPKGEFPSVKLPSGVIIGVSIDFFQDLYGIYDYAFYLRPINSVVYAVIV